MSARWRWIAVVAVLAGAGFARAEIIVDQQPYQGGGYGSDTLFRDEFNRVVWQQIADNILLNEAATIRHVGWWAFYGGSGTPATPPPISETIRIRFYGANASDGLPDNDRILLEATFPDANRKPTGRFIAIGGRPNEYRFDVDLPVGVSLEAGSLYWIEIVQLGDVDSYFRWETGFGAVNGLSFRHTFLPNWQAESGSMAFELSTVPEPAAALFLLMGACIWKRRWR